MSFLVSSINGRSLVGDLGEPFVLQCLVQCHACLLLRIEHCDDQFDGLGVHRRLEPSSYEGRPVGHLEEPHVRVLVEVKGKSVVEHDKAHDAHGPYIGQVGVVGDVVDQLRCKVRLCPTDGLREDDAVTL